jgi:hypothetical protein
VRLNSLSFDPNPPLQLCPMGSDGIASELVADSIGQALCFTPRMRAEPATVRPSLRCGRGKILLR